MYFQFYVTILVDNLFQDKNSHETEYKLLQINIHLYQSVKSYAQIITPSHESVPHCGWFPYEERHKTKNQKSAFWHKRELANGDNFP